jgi:Bifunctional DNA primase/polymerase, N-terminal/Primase C terminal 1 (PriCT-1)
VTSESPVLAGALRLAGSGRPVFPCQPGGKAPLGELVPHGLNDATTDARQIRAWFAAEPAANLGLRTGAVSRLVVLDVDGDEGTESLRALEREFGALPPTTSVKTPSGGSHYYFQHPGREIKNSAGQVGDHLDVRGDGGYVLVPPSIIDGRFYTPDDHTAPASLPSWLLSLIGGQTSTARARRAPTPASEWVAIMRGLPAGQRNQGLTRLAGYLLGRGGQRASSRVEPLLAQEIVLQAARNCRPPLEEAEALQIVESIAGKELSR